MKGIISSLHFTTLQTYKLINFIFVTDSQLLFFLMGFTPCKAEQPLRGMEVEQIEAQKG